MSGWRVWKCDRETGVTTYIMHDGDVWHYKTVAPADQIIDENKRMRAELAGKRHKDGVGDLVARVPMSVAYGQGLSDALVQGDQRFLTKWLNDGDNAAFRVKERRV